MAKGAETDDFVVLSKVRTGLKREFAFALKSQNEIAGSLGRTRTRKPANGLNGAVEAPSCKRIKKSVTGSRNNVQKDDAEGVNDEIAAAGGVDESGKGENDVQLVVESEGDLKSDVVDAVSDDDNRSHSVESLRTENDAGLTVISSNDERKCGSDYSKGNGVIPLSDVEMEEATDKEMSIGQPSIVVMNDEDEEVQDLPGKEDGIVIPEKPRKRFTRSALTSSSEEPKELPNTGGVGGDGTSAGGSLIAKNVHKVSSKSLVKMVPKRLKDLLDTGVLEGLSVRYSRGVKHKSSKEIGLQGVVKGLGILCYCEDCKGTKVVTPSLFEMHAGSSNKRPPDYMYLDNGNTLRDVLNACKESKLDNLEATIRKAIGYAAKEKSTYCVTCKGSISVAGKRGKRLLCDACIEIKAPEETPKKVTKTCDRPPEQLVHKSSDNAKKSSASGNKSQGKLTRKDLRLHKLVFEDDVLPDGTEVGYYVRGKKILSGYKQGSGILCSCCQKEISPSQFESHAGWASRRKPYLHIYTSNGVSLHELSVSLSRTMRFSTKDNDDLCTICYQPGHLLCCDGCPRSFHQECIPLLEVPDDTWYCRYCSDMFQREKFAERNANAIAAGRVAGIDPIEQIVHRCIRIVKTQDQESDSGGCALCRAHDFAKGGFGRRTVLLCDQCEREFHVGCLQDHGMQDLKELPEGKWFCCSGCNRINSVLQQLVEDADQQIPDCLLDTIKRKHAATGHEDVKLDIKWRLLSGKMSAVGNSRALLSKAVSVLHEQFDPIVPPNSNQDMIPHMVYGRNVKDKEFGGMYCAVLTVNSVIVSAGIFRILGKDIAELPLVATASGHEKLGYFQVLYSCIEKLLGELDVNHLWLPAADEAKPLWTNRFGFSDFPNDEFVEFKKRFALMIFDGTCALRKPISSKPDSVDPHEVAIQNADDTSEKNHMDASAMATADMSHETQDTGELLDNTTKASKDGDLAMQISEISLDSVKQTADLASGNLKEVSGIAQDGKQAVGENAMEVEVLPDGEMEVLDGGDCGVSQDQEGGDR